MLTWEYACLYGKFQFAPNLNSINIEAIVYPNPKIVLHLFTSGRFIINIENYYRIGTVEKLNHLSFFLFFLLLLPEILMELQWLSHT